ncbi:glycosyltransferase 61 family protein [Brevibacterium casei]|uniref:glycosyltransferase 61 family protein n=1 Tax=Brevibacterium casei TaxID=33889 RepID=UPI00246934EC|nr:glycosyltransferase 61 family protein [Brevibacterium casei]MDH5150438.1 glycosyltransferase 61 family protein [Brevibacterium casei]
MTDKDILAGTPAEVLEIWNDNGSIDRFKLNSALADLRLNGELDRVKAITRTLEQLRQELSFDPSNTVQVSRSKIQAIESFEASVAQSDDFRIIKLALAKVQPLQPVPDSVEMRDLPPGRWTIPTTDIRSFSTFDKDFTDLDSSVVSMIEASGFHKEVKSDSAPAFRIVEEARFHNFNNNFYTVSFREDGHRAFDRFFAARVAGESVYNAIPVDDPTQELDFAIVLPIEVANTNYYHALIEKIYGMSMLNLADSNTPIIHTPDPFGLVDVFAEKLGIAKDRFISFDDARSLQVNKAALLSKGPYSWTRSTFDFFGQFSARSVEPTRKLFVSRAGDSRQFTNEREIQQAVAKLGYETIYPERLSIDDQIAAFASAKSVIAGHGAGLANISFMSRKSNLVELFPVTLVKPDYYLRSRGNEMDYSFLIAGRDGSIDIQRLLGILRRNRLLVVEADGSEQEVEEYPGLKITFGGVGNVVKIEADSVFTNSRLDISHDSSLYIEKTSRRGIRNTVISMGGSMSNKSLHIGRNIQIEGSHISMAGEDDLKMTIGSDNLWSSNVVIRATDGHPIFERANPGVVVNRAGPLVIGDDVWIGSSVVIMKGVEVGSGSVVGQGALVSKSFDEKHVVIAGNPARVVKRDIYWKHEYIARDSDGLDS